MTVKLKSNLYIVPVNIFPILTMYMTTATDQNKHDIIHNNHSWEQKQNHKRIALFSMLVFN